MDKIPITPQGFTDLQDELKNLKEVERPAIIDAIATARDHGDLKENAEYHSAREKQGFIEGRIQELEAIKSLANVIDYKDFSGDTVKFGASILIYDEDTDEEINYQIVGDYEADIEKNLLSLKAPISRGLIGKSVGDVVKVQTPGGMKSYEILEVDYN